MQKSSNIGVSRLALRMPSTALVDTYSKVGFGKDTGLGLGEQRGTNGDRKRWSDIERATLAYGYGLNVTRFNWLALMQPLAASAFTVRFQLPKWIRL